MKTLLALALSGFLAACASTTPSREKEDKLIPTKPSEDVATAANNRS